MHVLIVYSHPEANSFNGTLKDVAVETLTAQGHTVEVSDLYAEGFDPVERAAHFPERVMTEVFSPLAEQKAAGAAGTLPADVRREIARLERADLVILQFPMWWHGLPAMLKGWYDRVFVNGALYTSRMRYDRGYFRGKRAMCSFTSGAPQDAFGPASRGGDLDAMLYPIQYSLYYMGFDVLAPFHADAIQGHGYSYQDAEAFERHLAAHKAAWARRLAAIEDDPALPFPGWSDWDEKGRLRRDAATASRPDQTGT